MRSRPGRSSRSSGRTARGRRRSCICSSGSASPAPATLASSAGRLAKQASLVLPRIGFVAQDHPLYRGFTLAETLKLGRKLNPRWDSDLATRRLAGLGIPLGKKVGKLSGGQQAQVALTLALTKRPDLLVLDEPIASLDPLARREFLQGLMEAVADEGLTVILSSHIVAELERVCDHLVILAAGGVQLAGSIEELLRTHRVLSGPRREIGAVALTHDVIQKRHTTRQTTLFVRGNDAVADPSWSVDEASLEEIVLAISACRPLRLRSPPWSWRRDLADLAPTAHRDVDRAGPVVLVAVQIVPTGLQMASVYDSQGIAACLTDPSDECRQTLDSFSSRWDTLLSFVGWLSLVPMLLGALIAVPLSSRC